MPHIAILILAAGASSRMGQPKQLLPWGNGTLLQHAIRQARGTGIQSVSVVLGAQAEIVQKSLLNDTVGIFINPNWEDGLGNSLAYGVKNLLDAENTVDGILVMLADQPLMDVSYLKKLVHTFTTHKKDIICTAYGKRSGVPAVFGSPYFSQLKELNKDYGAKEIIQKHKNDVFTMDPKGKAIDLDTMEAYKTLRAKVGA